MSEEKSLARQARSAQDERVAQHTEHGVLNLLGPADGGADFIVHESLRLNQLTRGLDPETAAMRIVAEKWAAKKAQIDAEKRSKP